MAYGNSLSGNQSLAYVGTSANQPPNWTFETRDPNQYDINSRIGDLWMNTLLPNNGPWVLISLQGTANSRGPLATWVPWSGGIRSETGNSGGPVYGDANRNINVVGDGVTVDVVGDPTTNTLTISANGSGVLETLTGNTGSAVSPLAGNISVIGDGMTITIAGNPGTHTLTASAIGTGLIQSLTTDDTHVVTPTGGTINIHGGAGITTTGTVGPDTVTISLAGGGVAAQSFVTDAGTATPTAMGVLDVFGDGHNITVTAPGSAHEVEVGLTGITQHSLQVGGATNSLTQLGVATNGQIPIGSTGADPVLATITPGANVTITNGPGTITIASTGGTFPASANSFLAYTNNLTAPFTNGGNTVPYANTVFNNGGIYNTGTYTFTAPISGYYHLTACLNLAAVNYTPNTVTSYAMQFVTTTDTYLVTNASPYADAAYISNGPVYGFNITGSTICYMTAGDTAYVEIDITNTNEIGNPVIDVAGHDTFGGKTRLRSFFSGYLVEGGNGAITQLHTDDGHDVTATSGVINIHGANGITTTGTAGPNTVTVSAAAAGNSFFAYVSAETLTNPFTGGENTVPYDSTLFNNGGHYNTGTYTYTAPVTGYYSFTATIALNHMGAGSTVTLYALQFNSTSALYTTSNFNPYAAGGYQTGPTNTSFEDTSTIFCHMTAGDTMYVDLFIDNTNAVGNPVVDVTGVEATSPTRYRTYFSGYQVA